MHEKPNFSDFSPEDQKYFAYLDRLWERLPFETYRIDYLKTIIARSKTVADYVENPDNPYRAIKLCEQNDIARSYFLYYLDKLFATPPERTDRAHYLFEMFQIADLSQEKINEVELGEKQQYGQTALRTTIEEILLGDSEEKVMQDIIDMYDLDIYDAAHRFAGQV